MQFVKASPIGPYWVGRARSDVSPDGYPYFSREEIVRLKGAPRVTWEDVLAAKAVFPGAQVVGHARTREGRRALARRLGPDPREVIRFEDGALMLPYGGPSR